MKAEFISRRKALDLPPRLDEEFEHIHEPIARWLQQKTRKTSAPVMLGINGAQGSGKSTFSDLLSAILKDAGLKVVVCSIDDFYLTRDDRLTLSESVHPLCLHRGVPGTHDIDLALNTFDKLANANETDINLVPRFDKARDDRSPEDQWEKVQGRPDLVIFEGWCVGARDLPIWEGPINDREARDDPKGTWCNWTRKALTEQYGELFSRLDALVMIRVPSMDTVHRSRWLQEQKLWKTHEAAGDSETCQGLMTKEQVREYVQLFARMTQHMLQTMPERADILIKCGEAFDYKLIRMP